MSLENPRILNPCAKCPNNLANVRRTHILQAGQASVLMSPFNGCLRLAWVGPDNDDEVGRGSLTVLSSAVDQNHPYLVTRVNACTEPTVSKVPRVGVLGKLGLPKYVRVCEPLARDFVDATSPAVVQQFVMEEVIPYLCEEQDVEIAGFET